MSFEASEPGRALLARVKSFIRDYAECMEAWEFIMEALQGRSVKHCFAWQVRAESPSEEVTEQGEATKVAVTTDRGFFDFTFANRRLQCVMTRLSVIAGLEERRYSEPDDAGMAIPIIQAVVCRPDAANNRVWEVRGIEETVEFLTFLRGVRQQLLK